MWVDHRRQPAIVGNPQHTDTPVIVSHILQQPLYRVVSVGTLIDAFQVALISYRAHHDELTFRLEAPANVLKHKYVTVRNQILQIFAEQSGYVAVYSIRASKHYERQWFS